MDHIESRDILRNYEALIDCLYHGTEPEQAMEKAGLLCRQEGIWDLRRNGQDIYEGELRAYELLEQGVDFSNREGPFGLKEICDLCKVNVQVARVVRERMKAYAAANAINVGLCLP